MIGYEPNIFKPERIVLSNEHWLSIKCTSLEVDARRDFCIWAEEFVAELTNGSNTNEFGEADTMLYDVMVEEKNQYISVKSSSNATSVRDCIARSRVKASPLLSAISLRKPDEIFSQVYLQYIPDDREICWFETPIKTFAELLENYNSNIITIDKLGRLSTDSHDIIFGEPTLRKIIDLPEINHKLEELKTTVISLIKRTHEFKRLNMAKDILELT